MNKLFSILWIPLVSVALAQTNEIAKPEEFQFGSSVSAIKLKLTSHCSSITERIIKPITAPFAKESQIQLECSGFEYGGRKREIELVFQDNQLDLVWILFPAKEKEELLGKFESLYGSPSMDIEYGTIFLQANAVIRNQPTEILFASGRQVKVMLKILAEKRSE